MNREEVLGLLRSGREGVAKWNYWKQHNWQVTDLCEENLSGLDLTGVNLIGMDLKEINLSSSNLLNASLTMANLSEANLSGANLGRADFEEANLCQAILIEAKCVRTNFTSVDFTLANIEKGDLSRTYLNRALFAESVLNLARFSGARMRSTIIASPLTHAVDLDQIEHQGPSHLSTATLLTLPDPFPEKFLRGCGVSNALIDVARAHQGVIQFYSCFISYSHKDEEFAKRIHADLQESGVRCWFAPHDLKPGERVQPTINEAIRLRDKIIVILSEDSVQSDWVELEVTRGLAEEKKRDELVMFPLRLDNAVFDVELGWARQLTDTSKPTGLHVADFRNWKDHDTYKAAFDKALPSLKKALGK